MGLFKSWSAVQRYKEAKNADPVPVIEKKLRSAWKENSPKKATWKIILKAGKTH
ncbi:MAG: hypothetical protein WCD31_02820 [Gillisia sp.]